ncbi:hypothetical protein Ddye_013563 [Dipteronia dyeriana]|uniref:Endonuclease/exonuclease/phosphatase domain-containing protein n=1 Tax=Dipteronia dyeriana TaxID=168575 RepID=A0AAD9X6N2_9ROSI|nr:hypothetical protein Ddye_013563 [Dipteronia dyeriana]
MEKKKGNRSFTEVVMNYQKKARDVKAEIETEREPLKLENGGALGDFLFIETESLICRRLDRCKMLVAILKDRSMPKFVKVDEGKWAFNVLVKKEESTMDIDWLTKILELKFEFPLVKKTMEQDQRKNGSDRFYRKDEKMVVVSRKGCKAVSSASSSELSSEERQLKEFGLFTGECSHFKTGGLEAKRFGPMIDNGPLSGVGLDFECSGLNDSIERSSSYSLKELRKNKSFWASRDVVKDPNHILTDLNRKESTTIIDHEGDALSISLKGIVQLPLRDSEGGQIMGKDLVAIPIEVDLGGAERISSQNRNVKIALNKLRLNWDLEDEIAKRVVSTEIGDGSEDVSKAGLILEDEIAKVIEVGVALGFDFNEKENVLEDVIARREKEDDEKLAAETFSTPWCVGGDFNMVLDPSERIGVSVNVGSMRSFASFIAQANIIDIPLHGISYTWSNNREKEAWARLDRFLLSPIILGWFPDLYQGRLPRSLTDHNPVMIAVLRRCGGLFPFRFLNWWLEEKEMIEDAVKGWSNCVVSGL